MPRWKRGVRRGLYLTTEGLLFIPLMGSVGFAAINTGANLLYLIFAMMAGLMSVSALASWMNIRRLDVRRIIPDGVPIDEEARIGLVVENKKSFFFSYALRMVDLLDKDHIAGVAFLFRLPVKQSQTVEYSTRFSRRGRHHFHRVRISSRFPFGLAEKSISWKEPGEILVYPKLYPAREFLQSHGIDIGDYETGRRGHGASLFGLRDYIAGDSAQSIHWKISARRGELVVREMEAEDHRKVTLILDNHVAPKQAQSCRENFERAVSCLASVGAEFLNANFQVEVLTRLGRVPYDFGAGQLRRILRSMAIIELDESEKPAPLPPIDSDSMLFWIGYGNHCTCAGALELDATAWPPSSNTAPLMLKEAV